MTQWPLYPHQNTGIIRIASRTPTYLGFDMGIGKSRTFIEAAKVSGGARFLILCPASAVLVWKREIKLWDPVSVTTHVKAPAQLAVQPPIGIRSYLLVTHGLMSQRDGDVAKALQSCIRFDFTAIDEAQGFNSEAALRVKALQRAAPNLGFIVPLSGTPMKNHAGELFTLTKLCWPQGMKLTRTEYEDQFCRIGAVSVQTKYGRKTIRTIEGSKNIPQLKRLLAPFMLRVKKEDVLTDLPPISWNLVPVGIDLTMMPEADVKEMEARILDMVKNTQGPVGSDAFVRALTVAGTTGHLMKMRRQLGLAKLKGACEYLVDMLDQLPEDRKVLVFAVHQDVISALLNHLGEYDPAVIVGATTGTLRDQAVEKFLTKPSCRVFLGNIQAAGTALTLVGPTCKCSDVVFVESSWTPMDNAQAACRIHRIGQKDGVMAKMLTATGTIDDLIQGVLARKAGEFSNLFDTKGETT